MAMGSGKTLDLGKSLDQIKFVPHSSSYFVIMVLSAYLLTDDDTGYGDSREDGDCGGGVARLFGRVGLS